MQGHFFSLVFNRQMIPEVPFQLIILWLWAFSLRRNDEMRNNPSHHRRGRGGGGSTVTLTSALFLENNVTQGELRSCKIQS